MLYHDQKHFWGITETANCPLVSILSFFSVSAGNLPTKLKTIFPSLPVVRHAHITMFYTMGRDGKPSSVSFQRILFIQFNCQTRHVTAFVSRTSESVFKELLVLFGGLYEASAYPSHGFISWHESMLCFMGMPQFLCFGINNCVIVLIHAKEQEFIHPKILAHFARQWV